MPGHQLIIQHLVLTGVGVLPTVPNPATLTPDDIGWVANSDILIGQHVYNRTDNKWYYRSGTNIIDQLTSSGSGSTNFSKVLFVDPNGDDGVGTKGDMMKPFLTIEAAVVAATSGDTIEVMPGSYTPISNLAKNGVTFYFHPGSIVTKTTSGAIFDFSATATYTSDINILGYGSFYKTTTSGEVFTIYHNRNGKRYVFQFNIAGATHSNTFNITTFSYTKAEIWQGKIKGVYAYSSGGCAIASTYDTDYTPNPDIIQKISINKIISTAGIAIDANSLAFNVTSDYVYSSVSYGIFNSYQYNNVYSSYNIGYISGVPYGFYNNSGQVTLNGAANSICNIGFNGTIIHNGNVTALTVGGGNYIGNGVVRAITQTDGYSEINTVTNYNYGSGGTAFNISGGTCKINGNLYYQQYGYGFESFISGTAKVIISANVNLAQDYTDADAWLTISGGICVFQGKLMFMNNGDIHNRKAFIKTGGTLILNGASMVKYNADQQFINCPATPQDIMVYSGGVTTNGTTGDLLAAKKRKDKLTVSGVVDTKIILNDGSGASEAFSETDVLTYDTKAKLAQRMVELINASATCDITATQDNAGTDEYFYIEADVAGIDYTQGELNNLTNLRIRLNSYAITNITPNAVIIEDSNVTY